MQIHGRERGFRLTVGASQEIAALCPGGELTRIQEIMTGDYAEMTDAIMQIIYALSKGDEDARSFEEPGYMPAPLTIAELKTLTPAELGEVQREALAAFAADHKPTVETEPEKGSKKKISETP